MNGRPLCRVTSLLLFSGKRLQLAPSSAGEPPRSRCSPSDFAGKIDHSLTPQDRDIFRSRSVFPPEEHRHDPNTTRKSLRFAMLLPDATCGDVVWSRALPESRRRANRGAGSQPAPRGHSGSNPLDTANRPRARRLRDREVSKSTSSRCKNSEVHGAASRSSVDQGSRPLRYLPASRSGLR